MRADSRNRELGFTLIEMMVVLVILAVLITVIVPNVIGKSDEAKQTKGKADIAMLESLLDQYYLDMGQFPSTEEGLNALYKKPDDAGDKWKGPYSKKPIPADPWGNPYHYENPGTHSSQPYEIVCFGRDKREGGEGYDADLVSWTQEGDEKS